MGRICYPEPGEALIADYLLMPSDLAMQVHGENPGKGNVPFLKGLH